MKLKNQTLYLLAFLLFFASFSFNIFKLTDENYIYFDRSDEANIISRLMINDKEGFFSYSALQGHYFYYQYELHGDSTNLPEILRLAPDGNFREIPLNTQIIQKYDDFINSRETYGGNWVTYKTMPGGVGMIYSILHIILPFNNATQLKIFRAFNITLCILAFLLFVGWVQRNFGNTSAFVTFLLLFLSPWLIKMSYNLWWATWTHYIPFLAMLLILERRDRKKQLLFDNKLLLYLVLAVFAKFFLFGAEFISTVLIMAVCPIIYYLIISKTDFKGGIIYFAKSCTATLGGILVGFFLLITQIKFLEGSWKAGIDHIIFSFLKRSALSDGVGKINLEHTSITDVITLYINDFPFLWEGFPVFKFGFGFVILLITIFSIIVYYLNRKEGVHHKNTALVITTIISFFAPLSWFVLFTQHALEHTFIDYITWYMPYFLYGFAVIGLGLDLIVKIIGKKLHKSRNPNI